jgi:2-keto-4-pentenoate hydratase/2-oxohepta-3-ene-1,7-dioic acid hydratase in catechol pathway
VAADLLTNAGAIEVLGDTSSGEVEFVLLSLADGLWVAVGSDHTDRKAEAIGVSLSKQMCAKPISAKAWRADDVLPHWERLVLRSYAKRNGKRSLYQEGSVATMRTPDDLIKRYTGASSLPAGTAMFCGTLAVHGEIGPAERFEMELEDPVLERELTHAYDIKTLPDEG